MSKIQIYVRDDDLLGRWEDIEESELDLTIHDEEVAEKAKAQGRAEAIDECINEICRECDEQDLYLPIHIRYILEKLKEQRDDS